MQVEYCPTDDMWADFFSKAQQGESFNRMRADIMGVQTDPSNQVKSKEQPKDSKIRKQASKVSLKQWNAMSRMKTNEWCKQLRGDGELQNVIRGTQEKIYELDQRVYGSVNEDVEMTEKKASYDDSDVCLLYTSDAADD